MSILWALAGWLRTRRWRRQVGLRLTGRFPLLLMAMYLTVPSHAQIASDESHKTSWPEWGQYQWSTFKAEGLPAPVTGVIYRDGASREGVPLGGLGTGFIFLQTDG